MMKKFINICDKHGKSALAYAAQKGQIGLVKILLERGAVPITRDYKSRVRYHHFNNHIFIETY